MILSPSEIGHECISDFVPSWAFREIFMASLKLHDLELSGNCYKVRLFCGLLGLRLELDPVDFLAGAHKKSPVIDLNPFGQIPVLEDGDVALRDFAGDPRLSRAEIWRRGLATDRRRRHGRSRVLAHGRGE